MSKSYKLGSKDIPFTIDTSEEYFDMSREAKEIQEGWSPQIGDFVYQNHPTSKEWICGIIAYPESVTKNIEIIAWLPRQDQLQNILKKDLDKQLTFWHTIMDFERYFKAIWRDECKNDYPNEVNLDRLWLNFFMKKKYNKTWSGKNWVLIKDKDKKSDVK